VPEFFSVMQRRGFECKLVGAREYRQLVGACGAFVKSGKLNRHLEIVSLSHAARESVFGLDSSDFARSKASFAWMWRRLDRLLSLYPR